MSRVPRQILVYVFRRRRDGAVDFLLLHVLADRGGFWQGVTGAPEREETDEQAAVREVLEETGFDVEPPSRQSTTATCSTATPAIPRSGKGSTGPR